MKFPVNVRRVSGNYRRVVSALQIERPHLANGVLALKFWDDLYGRTGVVPYDSAFPDVREVWCDNGFVFATVPAHDRCRELTPGEIDLWFDVCRLDDKARCMILNDSVAWIRIVDAETLTGINRGVISRAAEDKEMRSNGKDRLHRRLDTLDFVRWALEYKRRPEPRERDEIVRRQLEAAKAGPLRRR